MIIAGVIILTDPEKPDEVEIKLNQIPNVTTYGVHKGNNIVAVFEGESSRELENISKQISETIPGVIGIYPAYVNYEDSMAEENEV